MQYKIKVRNLGEEAGRVFREKDFNTGISAIRMIANRVTENVS